MFKKEFWKTAVQIAIAILSAIATTLGVSACII